MSTLYMFPPNEKPAEDTEMVAGEYVLGVMDPGEAAATRMRADTDPVLLCAIGVWQARFAILTGMLADVPPPPELWARLATEIGMLPEPPPEPPAPPAIEPEPEPVAIPEAVIAAVEPEPLPEVIPEPIEEPPTPTPYVEPSPPAPVQATFAAVPEWDDFEPFPVAVEPEPAQASTRLVDRIAVWRIATGASLVLAIGLGILAFLPHTGFDRAVAAIGMVNAPAPIYLAEADAAGNLRITPLAIIAVPNGRDLQLWMIPPNTPDPVSLGVLPPNGRTVSLGGSPAEGTRFIVTMEPRGGSPSGRITGQVLYGGTLANR